MRISSKNYRLYEPESREVYSWCQICGFIYYVGDGGSLREVRVDSGRERLLAPALFARGTLGVWPNQNRGILVLRLRENGSTELAAIDSPWNERLIVQQAVLPNGVTSAVAVGSGDRVFVVAKDTGIILWSRMDDSLLELEVTGSYNSICLRRVDATNDRIVVGGADSKSLFASFLTRKGELPRLESTVVACGRHKEPVRLVQTQDSVCFSSRRGLQAAYNLSSRCVVWERESYDRCLVGVVIGKRDLLLSCGVSDQIAVICPNTGHLLALIGSEHGVVSQVVAGDAPGQFFCLMGYEPRFLTLSATEVTP